jgi:hypothetical protein
MPKIQEKMDLAAEAKGNWMSHAGKEFQAAKNFRFVSPEILAMKRIAKNRNED